MIVFFLCSISFYFIVDWLDGSLSPWSKIAVSYLLGLGTITYFSFLLFLAGIPITTATFVFLFGTAGLINFVFYRRRQKLMFGSKKKKKNNFTNIPIILQIPIAIYMVSLLLFGLYWPVRDWDALTLYDFRAKVISETHTPRFLESTDANYYFAYPLYTSLVHTMTEKMDISSPMFFYGLSFSTFALLFYESLQEKINNKTVSAISLLLLVTSPVLYSHALIAYTNLPYALFFVASFIFLTKWVKNQDNKLLFLVCILGGLSIWVRDAEPFWTLIPLSVLVFSQSNRWRKSLFSLLVFLFFILPWAAYKKEVLDNFIYQSTVVSVFSGIKLLSWQHFIHFLLYFYNYFIQPYLGIHFIFLLTIIRYFLGYRRREYQLGLFFMFGIYILIAAGTVYMSLTYEKWLKVGGSLERMSIFLLPLSYYLACSQWWQNPHVKK